MPGQAPATQSAAIFDFNGTLVTGEVWQAIESWMGGRSQWKRRKTRMILRQLPVILASKIGVVSADFMVRRWMPAAWATVRGMDERGQAVVVEKALQGIETRSQLAGRWRHVAGVVQIASGRSDPVLTPPELARSRRVAPNAPHETLMDLSDKA